MNNYLDGGSLSSFEKGKVIVSVATLNQWSLDFDGNETRIKQAITLAKKDNAKLILLPELATCGYSCQDHFLEREIHELSFNVIRNIMKDATLKNIVIAVGCPIIHNDVRYNTTIFILNQEIILIRPKMLLADDGNYREARWFTPWPREKYETFEYLDINNKVKIVPIGVGILNFNGVLVAAEICEELWTPSNINSELYLNGVDIIVNGSGSHFEGDKLKKRKRLLKSATKRSGGAYLYSNLEGGDGDRLYFDGGSMIAVNGEIVNIEERFTLHDVKVISSDIYISSILSYRMKNNSFGTQATRSTSINKFNTISVNFDINNKEKHAYVLDGGKSGKNSKSGKNKEIHKKEKGSNKSCDFKITDEEIEEIANSASCWLWDYVRRSGAMGFMLPLSGGADSACTATIVYNMCLVMAKAYNEEIASQRIPNKNVKEFFERFYTRKDDKIDKISAELLCSRLLNTVYLPTKISGKDDNTKKDLPTIKPPQEEIIKQVASMKTGFLSAQLAKRINSSHKVVDIQGMFEAGINGIKDYTNVGFKEMTEEVKKGRDTDKKSKWDILYQNIQARLRMINTYLLAQATPNLDNKYKNSSFLLVLGSSNADEILVGYYTKYDASAADINPIGSMSKTYVNRMLDYFGDVKGVVPLLYIRGATPTAELIETTTATKQTDETDMGITYKQIFELGRLRASGYGPIDSYLKIIQNSCLLKIFSIDAFGKEIEPKVIVDRFFIRYNINRNKTTIIPPSVHLLPSPDDNRYDLRPFLYPSFRNSKQQKTIGRINL